MANDLCDTQGAYQLKQRIEAYWRERGYDVVIDLVEAGFTPAMRSARTDVRSNMINGMPVRRERPSAGQYRRARGFGQPNFA